MYRGSILAESLDKKLIKSYHIEPVTRMMGIGLHSFKEFSKENIESFNLLCMNSDKLKVFSKKSLYYLFFSLVFLCRGF